MYEGDGASMVSIAQQLAGDAGECVCRVLFGFVSERKERARGEIVRYRSSLSDPLAAKQKPTGVYD